MNEQTIPTLDECYKNIPFPDNEQEAVMYAAGIADCYNYMIDTMYSRLQRRSN